MTLQAFVDRHADPVWVVDPGFERLLHANPAACALFRATREALLVRPPAALGLAGDCDRLVQTGQEGPALDLALDRISVDWDGQPALMLALAGGPPNTDGTLSAAVGTVMEDVAFDWDIPSDRLIWSPEACARFGLDPATLPETSVAWLQQVHPEDRDRVADALERVLAQPDRLRWTEAYRLMRTDGSVTQILERGQILLDADGKPSRMLGTMMDVNRIAELVPEFGNMAQRLETEHRLRHAMAEALPVIVFTLDRAGAIDFISHRFNDLTGLDPAAKTLDAYLSALHPADRAGAEALHGAALSSPRPVDIELRLRDAGTGGFRWHQIAVRPQRDAEGRVIKWYGVGVDIDARKRAEAALRESEARQRSLLELLPVAIWEEDWSPVRGLADRLKSEGVTDLRAHLQSHPDLLFDLQKSPLVAAANPAAWSIFSAQSDDDVARVHEQWFETPEARDSYIDEVVAFIEGTPPPPRELPVRTADGRPIRVIQRLGFSDSPAARDRVVHCLTDITDRIRTEERMRVASDLISDVIWDHDPVAGTNWCSEGFRTAYGHDPDMLARMDANWIDLVHPEDRARLLLALDQAEAKGVDTVTNEYRFQRADGTYAVVEDRVRYLRDESGELLRQIGVMVDVTAQRSEEERQRALVEIASDAIFEYHPEHQEITFGEGFRTVFGLDVVGRHPVPTPLVERFHPEDRDHALGTFFNLVESGERSSILEYRLRRGDGSWAHVQERVIVLRHSDGRPRRVFAGLVDITAERDSEERLRLAALASREVVFDYDIASDRMQWSGAAKERFGYDPEVFPGTFEDFVARVHPEDRHILTEARRALRHGEGVPELHEAQFRLMRADGSTAYVISRSLALRDAVGAPVRIVGMIFDVSELHREEERMRAIVEVSADAIWEYDPETNVMVFSEGLKSHFGHDWTGERPVPSPWRAAVHPEDLPRALRGFSTFLDGTGSRWRTAYRMKRGDGSWAHVEERVVALRDETGKALHVIGSFEDVTERWRLEEQLHTAQKMESIGRIAGGIAHDFNNLLAVIMGNAELSMETENLAEVREFGAEIVQASQRGAELTRRLLSFARRSHLAPKVINLNETVTGMSRLLSRAVPESIDMQTALTAGLWQTRVDPTFVESSLLNLVVNARDAMPEGGRLTIETGNMRVSESYVTERGEELAPGRYVMLAVSDTGTGIARDILDKVIEPFFTTKGPHLGTGLGLAMVHGFVRQSGGALRIYSEPGVGTTVKILLPAEPESVERAQVSTAERLADPMREGARILLVEDEDAVRRTVARILTERGHAVVEAASGDAALAAYERSAAPFDILLTDVVMPGNLQGPALAKELKFRQRGLGIVFMSGYANEAAVNGNGLRDDDLYLMKPVQRRDLLQVIDRLIEQLRTARKG